jgi:arsenite methyltransferase
MQRPQYGIDAPGLLRFFAIAGMAAFLVCLLSLRLPVFGQPLQSLVASLSGIATIYLLGMASLMLYYSKIEKLKDCEKFLDLIPWAGNEQVLDVGCGRGLMLIGAAKRLTSGKAIGIDLWEQEDQTQNHAAATLKNAAITGVTERIEVKTADMRQLPFPDRTFDVVVSSWAVHNLELKSDRYKALDEIIRVLKPNGRVVLADIENQAEYAAYFERQGMTQVKRHNNSIRDVVLKTVSFGSFAPSAVSADKGGEAFRAIEQED